MLKAWCVILIGLVCVGCTSYAERMTTYRAQLRSQQLDTVCDALAEEVEDATETDKTLRMLEYAAALRINGELERSDTLLDAVEMRMDVDADGAKISVTDETQSLVADPTFLKYRGMPQDVMMVNVYQVLNNLSLQRPERARTALRRAMNHKQRLLQAHEDEIAALRQAVASGTAQQQSTLRSASHSTTVSTVQRNLLASLPVTTGYAEYTNPFAEYLNALFRYHCGTRSEWEQARKSFEMVRAIVPTNPYVQQDLARLEKGDAPDATPTVYLIYETGFAPRREEVAITIPIFLETLPTVGIAYPKLVMDNRFGSSAAIESNGKNYAASLLCDMDKVVSQAFKEDVPGIFTRAIASAVFKAVAQVSLNRTVLHQTENDWAYLLAYLAGITYQISTNNADLRSWQLLPKQVLLAQAPLPSSRTVTLSFGGARESISLGAEGSTWVVYARAFAADRPVTIQTFCLR